MCFVWPLIPVKIGQCSSNSASCLVNVSKKTQLRDGDGAPGGGFWLTADFAAFAAGGVSPSDDEPRLTGVGSFLAGMARSAWTKEWCDEQLSSARTVNQNCKLAPIVI